MPTYEQQQPQLPVPYAPNAVPSRNPVEAVVVVATVLGTKTVAELAT